MLCINLDHKYQKYQVGKDRSKMSRRFTGIELVDPFSGLNMTTGNYIIKKSEILKKCSIFS